MADKLATVLLGKDSTWLNANLGSDANTTDCLYGWYDKEKVVDGNLFTQYRVNNTTQGKTLGDKLIALMRGEDAAQGFNYDNTQRYLFSDYATTHEDGFKITLQKNSKLRFVLILVILLMVPVLCTLKSLNFFLVIFCLYDL